MKRRKGKTLYKYIKRGKSMKKYLGGKNVKKREFQMYTSL